MKYKNICKFPIFIKSVGKQIAPGKVFEEISNSELNTLLKERKIEVIQYEDFVKKIRHALNIRITRAISSTSKFNKIRLV